MVFRSFIIRSAALLALCLGLIQCSYEPGRLLDRIKQRGELIVVTRNSPTSYFLGPQGYAGLEYDLASQFARRLGVKAKFIVADRYEQALAMVADGAADVAAAGLIVTEARRERVRFGPPYQKITRQVVYRMGSKRPKVVEDLVGKQLEIAADTGHGDALRRLRHRLPDLAWKENAEVDSEELLQLVVEQVIDYTIADSNELAINQHYYPALRAAFQLGEPKDMAWAFAPNGDDSLYQHAEAFFKELEGSGQIAQLLERHFGHVDQLNFADTLYYRRLMKLRLPKYENLFKQAARETGLDWRLLAAISYQESHWNPEATSPTGVRGLMMLTQDTARELDIQDRVDPMESIFGGARYFKRLLRRLPRRITEPDRTWMALAAYNVGMGHLEDARVLTQKRNGNPDKWVDVRESLPLLSQKAWYQQTRHGYARGREPVVYVENIRSFYDLLVWNQRREQIEVARPKPLYFDSPAL